MRRIVYGEDERVGDWVLARIGYPQAWTTGYRALGLERDGELIAGAVFTEYLPGATITASLAGRARVLWATAPFARACFRYAFVQCGVRRISAYIAASNERCQRLARHLGFREEGRLRHWMPAEDALVFGLLREEAGEWL